ncbi:MAG: hypothetical protein F4Y99_07125 [Acidimicrobiaceae bacterium]|nr:hypothetical protein [Acidimicrobiaceae bacterium]MYF42160.1 hypothetical protein [Acidimicrobiaceae bacterium]
MNTRPAGARTLVGVLTLAGLVAGSCGQDVDVAPTPEPSTTAGTSESALLGTPTTATTAASTTETTMPDSGSTEAQTPGTNTESTTEAPGTVPVDGDSDEAGAGTDNPDGSSRAGTKPATPVSREPRLAFVSNMNHDPEIVVWDVDGSSERLLTDNFDDDRLPAWSPNGSRVAFVSDRASDGDYDIYVVNADGSNPVQVTDDDYRETRLAWSPDGARIAYVRFTHDEAYYRPDDFRYGDDLSDYSRENFDIFVIDADGSNPVRVTDDDYRELAPMWSPDGTRIAYVRDTEPDQRGIRPEIIVVGADGADPISLAQGAVDPVWSPDGSLIAYQHRGSIHLVEPDGSSTRELVRGEGASWSPDGSLIVYSSDRSPASADRAGAGASTDGVLLLAANDIRLNDEPEPLPWEIHVIAPDRTNHTQLTQRSHAGWDKFDPQWSPDGTRILYAYPSWRGDGEVYVMNADGTESHLITDNGHSPGWSHDSSSIYYTRFRPLSYRALDIFVVHPDGTNLATLVADADNPAWSPDGTRIAYSSYGQITVANADGTGARQLTDVLTHSYEGRNFAPVWSPDGTRIAYNHGSTYSQTYLMDPDGTNKTLLSRDASRDRTNVWSPDGSKIAFDYGHGHDADDIAVINPDGTGLVNLTPDDERLGTSFEACPSWSPDGSKIAFVSLPVEGRANSDVWVIDVDGSNLTQLTHNPGSDGCPVWSPDGTRIIYSVWRGIEDYYDVADLWIMNADGSDRRLFKEHGTGPVLSPDGTQIAFISDRDGDWEIFVMDADGSNETQLTFNNDNDWGPVWFPLGG